MLRQGGLIPGKENEDDAIAQIYESLSQIEAILKAESKRRFEANQIS